MPFTPGARLDAYEIVRSLGSGGMGEVWLATEVRLGRKVALKVLPPDLTRDPLRVQRFEQEARAASALNHPNVCTIHALGETADGQHYIAMEYVEGETLRQRLSTSRLTIRESLDITSQVAAALSAAHGAGIVHRDVKPENVMLRPDGLVKVLDFGLAKLVPTASDEQVTQTVLHSNAGTIVGTAAYMSPEQVRGEALDGRTDIFSLGVVLYEMISGRQPFAAPSAAVVYAAILNTRPAPASTLRGDIPRTLEEIIDKALEKDRDLRYQSAAELRRDLARLQRNTDVDARASATVPDQTGSRHRPRAPGRRLITAAAVLLFLSIMGGLAIWVPKWPFGAGRAKYREVQLTTNSSEAEVTAAAISPDGKYLSFADPAGIHLRVIDSGDNHTVTGFEGGLVNRLAWFPDGTRLIVSASGVPGSPAPAVWTVSIIGGRPMKLRDDAMEASVSRDGSQIAFVDGSHGAVWVMTARGDSARKVVEGRGTDTLVLPGFWGPESRLTYGRVRRTEKAPGVISIAVDAESRDSEGHTSLVLSDPNLHGGTRVGDDRLVYSVGTGPASTPGTTTVWEVDVDPRTERPVSTPRQVAGPSVGVAFQQFSATRDGKRIVFLKLRLQSDVYVMDMASDGSLQNARRLTLDDSNDFVNNWTPDGEAIFLTSDRNGSLDVFRQRLDQRTAEPVIAGPDDEKGPTAVDRESGWLYYLVRSKRFGNVFGRTDTLMRAPAAGGPAEQVAPSTYYPFATCARGSSRTCVLIEQEDRRLNVYALDAKGERGPRIASTDVVDKFVSYGTDLSPDGSHVAIRLPEHGQIRLLSMQGGPTATIAVAGWTIDPAAIYWAPDGSGLYFASTSTTRTPPGTDLLFVDLSGRTRTIWHQGISDWGCGIPSPDGRHLALTQASTVSNVWMLEGS